MVILDIESLIGRRCQNLSPPLIKYFLFLFHIFVIFIYLFICLFSVPTVKNRKYKIPVSGYTMILYGGTHRDKFSNND